MALAEAYARKPEKIASRVYGGRMGNGPESSGDGWKFRGRGIIQLTGCNNYTSFGESIDKDVDQVIKYVQTKDGALESACWYWNSRNINNAAEVIAEISDGNLNVIKTVRKSDNTLTYGAANSDVQGELVINLTAEESAALTLDDNNINGELYVKFTVKLSINETVLPKIKTANIFISNSNNLTNSIYSYVNNNESNLSTIQRKLLEMNELVILAANDFIDAHDGENISKFFIVLKIDISSIE